LTLDAQAHGAGANQMSIPNRRGHRGLLVVPDPRPRQRKDRFADRTPAVEGKPFEQIC
jgi:hypothetical protein